MTNSERVHRIEKLLFKEDTIKTVAEELLLRELAMMAENADTLYDRVTILQQHVYYQPELINTKEYKI
jgi:hypothetical protein